MPILFRLQGLICVSPCRVGRHSADWANLPAVSRSGRAWPIRGEHCGESSSAGSDTNPPRFGRDFDTSCFWCIEEWPKEKETVLGWTWGPWQEMATRVQMSQLASLRDFPNAGSYVSLPVCYGNETLFFRVGAIYIRMQNRDRHALIKHPFHHFRSLIWKPF